ncbi:MAG TPA: glycosyltransferase family 9 protein [Acidimicrobiales bacterium]|nr:glycosyltransferase family 9 protein [Acidimicrobiales bacterium]
MLVARCDNVGDVLLAGPAVRAVAAAAGPVTFLSSPQGAPAAELLPGVGEVVAERLAWIDAAPPPVDRGSLEAMVDRLGALGVEEAVILTSWHQSPLPLAMLLRAAGVERITANSTDYPGSLLDVRVQVDDDLHEVERGVQIAAAAGFAAPAGDDLSLAVRGPLPPVAGLPAAPYVVLHPGASVPARAWAPARMAEAAAELARRGARVVVTGGRGEAELCAAVAAAAGPAGTDLSGRTDLAGLATVIASARAVVVGNTGPAHLAAAVGTPVVSLYAPTVPAQRWLPWRVPVRVLGDLGIPCAGCRARTCPVPGHPCIDSVPAAAVADAVDDLVGAVAA